MVEWKTEAEKNISFEAACVRAIRSSISDVSKTIAEAVTLSEREIRHAGNSLSEIYRLARSHARDLKDIRERFDTKVASPRREALASKDFESMSAGSSSPSDDSSGESTKGEGESEEGGDELGVPFHQSFEMEIDSNRTIGDVIAGQASFVSEFLSVLGERVSRQVEKTAEAVQLSVEVVKLARNMAGMAGHARFLALNLRIEAAALGELGSATAVIADEFVEFASDIRRTNDAVASIAEQISELLPAIRTEAVAIHAGYRAGEAENEAFLAHYRQAQEVVTTSLSSSAVSANNLKDAASEVLERLQFQDRMAQMLGCVRQELTAAGDFLMEVECIAPEGEESWSFDAFEGLRELQSIRVDSPGLDIPAETVPSSPDDPIPGEINFLTDGSVLKRYEYLSGPGGA